MTCPGPRVAETEGAVRKRKKKKNDQERRTSIFFPNGLRLRNEMEHTHTQKKEEKREFVFVRVRLVSTVKNDKRGRKKANNSEREREMFKEGKKNKRNVVHQALKLAPPLVCVTTL